MSQWKISRRYAKALFDSLEGDDQAIRQAAVVLEAIQDLFAEPSIRRVLTSPVMPLDLKKQVIEYAAQKAQADQKLLRFVSTTIDAGRAEIFEHLPEAFNRWMNLKLGRLQAQVSSVVELSEAQKSEIKQNLSSMTGKEIEVDYHINQDLLGGLMVRIDHQILDLSIKHRINQVAKSVIH